MSWESIMDMDGLGWEMDWEGVTRIVRAYCRSDAMLHHHKIVTDSSGVVKTQYVEVDWKKVKEDTDTQSQQTLMDWQSSQNLRLQFNFLIDYRARTLGNEKQFHALQQDLSKKTMANIEQAVRRGERGQKIAEVVRDFSAGVLVVGSGIVTGGAAWGVEMSGAAASTGALAAGAGLKGVAKYQEKHNIGLAVLEASTEVVTGLFSIGPVTEGAKEIGAGAAMAVKILGVSVGAVMDVGKTLVEGESMKKAVADAASKMAVKIAIPSEKLSKLAVPIIAKIAPGLARNSDKIAEFAVEYAADNTANFTGQRASRAFEMEVHEPLVRLHSKHSPGSVRLPAMVGAQIPRLADVVAALISGPGTDVDFVQTTALRRSKLTGGRSGMSKGSGVLY